MNSDEEKEAAQDKTFIEITKVLPVPYITCPKCHVTSYNRNDIQEGYCGACHEWSGLAQP